MRKHEVERINLQRLEETCRSPVTVASETVQDAAGDYNVVMLPLKVPVQLVLAA